MFPIGREKECQTIVQYLADTVTGRSNKILVVVGNCGSGKTSSMTSISQCFSTLEGRAMFHDLLLAQQQQPNKNNSNSNNNKTTNNSSSNSKTTRQHHREQKEKEKDTGIAFTNDSTPFRLPRLEYVHCAEKSSKLLLAEMTDRICSATQNGGFFAANVAPNSSKNNHSNNNSKNNNDSSSSALLTSSTSSKATQRKTSSTTSAKKPAVITRKDRERHQQAVEEERERTETALSMTFPKLEGKFLEALVTQSAIGGVTNNYISGHGSVIEDYKKMMKKKLQQEEKNKKLLLSSSTTEKNEDENNEEQDEDDINNNNNSEMIKKAAQFEKSKKPPFCFLVLDEIDTPGGGWRDAQFRSVMDKALSIKSVGVILIANRTDLKWLPANMTNYLTFESYRDEALANIARYKMNNNSHDHQSNNNNNNNNSSNSINNEDAAADENGKNASNNNNKNKNNNNNGGGGAAIFHPKALEFAAKTVAAHAGGDARRMIDHCRAAAADKWIKNTAAVEAAQEAKKLLDEKRSREQMEKETATTTTKKTTRTTTLSVSSRRNTTTKTSVSSLQQDAAAVVSNNNNNNSTRTSTSSNKRDNSNKPASSVTRNTIQDKHNNNKNNNNTADNDSMMITMSDVAAVIKTSTAHPGIEMLPALPQHAHLTLCCIANAVKVNLAREKQLREQQQTTIAFSGGQANRSYHQQGNNTNGNSNLVDLKDINILYQKLCKQLGIFGVDAGSFRDILGNLVDVQLLSVAGGNRFTLTVHQTEIESALKKLGAMYNVADELVRNGNQ